MRLLEIRTAALPRLSGAVIAIACAAACRADVPPELASTVPEGLRSAHTFSGERSAPRYHLTEVASSPPNVLLGQVLSLDVDSQGRIYVADWMIPGVTVLSPDAKLLRVSGRRGKGPGEFQNVSSVRVLPGDSVQVFDRGLSRLTVFAPGARRPAYAVGLTTAGLLSPYQVERAAHRNSLIAVYDRAYTPSDRKSDESRRRDVARLLDLKGFMERDSLLVFPHRENLVARSWGAARMAPNPFGRRGVVRLGPGDRLYYGWNGELSIRAYSLDGRRIGGFSHPHPQVPVTSGDFASAAETMDRRLRRELRRATTRSWPTFRTFVVDDRGRIWVGLTPVPGMQMEWAIFRLDGACLGSVFLPSNVSLEVIRRGTAYGVEKDSLDVPRVVVYRIDERLTRGA